MTKQKCIRTEIELTNFGDHANIFTKNLKTYLKFQPIDMSNNKYLLKSF